MYLKVFAIFIKNIFGGCYITYKLICVWTAATRLHIEVDLKLDAMLCDHMALKAHPQIYIYVIIWNGGSHVMRQIWIHRRELNVNILTGYR